MKSKENMLVGVESPDERLTRILRTQKYHVVGAHSAVKRCRWLYESIVHGRVCYKQKFYGIKSHQCIQMTPTVLQCNMRCLFCWRLQSGDLNVEGLKNRFLQWSEPETIVEGCVKAQLKILSGYKGNIKTDPEKYDDALTPKHVAISLAGEPTLYPHLSDLISCFHKRGFTTFLVSNGTRPETLSSLSEEPTQLYISLCAPDSKTFHKTCRPQTQNAWENILETLRLLSSFNCPTVIRITLVRHVNMVSPQLYAKLIKKASPTYVEPKAYMHVGFSRRRLNFENMPTHDEVRGFASKLARKTGYNVLDEAKESRVVLLSRLETPIKHGV